MALLSTSLKIHLVYGSLWHLMQFLKNTNCREALYLNTCVLRASELGEFLMESVDLYGSFSIVDSPRLPRIENLRGISNRRLSTIVQIGNIFIQTHNIPLEIPLAHQLIQNFIVRFKLTSIVRRYYGDYTLDSIQLKTCSVFIIMTSMTFFIPPSCQDLF